MFEDLLVYKIFVAAIAAAYLIYRLQETGLLWSIFFKRSPDSDAKDLLLKHRQNNVADKNGRRNIPLVFISRDFRKLKVVKQDNIIKYYFENMGSSLFNIKLKPLSDFIITITPIDHIKKGGSGCMEIYLTNKYLKDKIGVEATFTNHEGMPEMDIFYYDLKNDSLLHAEANTLS